jgi:hypothetical protein
VPRDVTVDDPENLKKDNILVRGLRYIVIPTESNYCSRDTTEPLDEEEQYSYNLEEETEYYNIFVNKGGRPLYPVSLGRDILENPREYSKILSYW